MPKRDPKTKEQLLDRMLSYDFNGDIRQLGAEPARIERIGANALRLTFPDTDTVFDLTVHRPREFAKVERKAEERSFGGAEQAMERRNARVEAEAPAPEAPAPRPRRQSRKRANASGQQGQEA